MSPIHIIGGGLAGTEAAWQIARRGRRAVLYEMRPVRATAAHQTDRLAELVCSNSLKSEQESTAPWLLKEELRRLGSLLLAAAQTRARARRPRAHGGPRGLRRRGHRRHRRASRASSCGARKSPRFPRTPSSSSPPARSPATRWPARSRASPAPAACSSTTASAPSWTPKRWTPAIAFWASRYGKSTDGTDDYLNCPFDRDAVRALRRRAAGARSRVRRTSPRTPRRYFEACLPIEELARARPRHAALRPHEADGADRSAHRPAALRRGAAAPGEPARRQLQPGGLPEPSEIRRAGAHSAPDSRAWRTPSSCASARSIATPTSTRPRCSRPRCSLRDAARGVFRRPDFGRGRLRGSHRHGPDGGHARRRAGRRRDAARRCRARPRWARCATTSPAPTPPITSRPTSPSTCCRSSTKPRASNCGATSRRATPKSAGRALAALEEYRLRRLCLSWPARSNATSTNWRARGASPPHAWTPMPPICASFWNSSRRPRPSRPSRAPSTC